MTSHLPLNLPTGIRSFSTFTYPHFRHFAFCILRFLLPTFFIFLLLLLPDFFIFLSYSLILLFSYSLTLLLSYSLFSHLLQVKKHSIHLTSKSIYSSLLLTVCHSFRPSSTIIIIPSISQLIDPLAYTYIIQTNTQSRTQNAFLKHPLRLRDNGRSRSRPSSHINNYPLHLHSNKFGRRCQANHWLGRW